MIADVAKTRPRWQAFLYLCLALALVGCARTVARDPAPSPSASHRPIPLKVAVYMDDAFRQYTYRERHFHLPLGELLSKRLPASLATLFTETEVITDPVHVDPGAGKYQALLRPQIRFASYHPFFRERRTLLEPEGRVRIYSAWTLSDRSGREIWFQEIVGQAEGDDRSRSRLEGAVEAAADDLLRKLQSALMSSSQIAREARRRP